MKKLDEFLNEAKTFQAKRKYGKYDSIHLGNNAPIRTSILGFINEKGICTKKELIEYIKVKNEASEDKKGNTSIDWIKKNERFFIKSQNENGETTFKLSYLGKKVIDRSILTED